MTSRHERIENRLSSYMFQTLQVPAAKKYDCHQMTFPRKKWGEEKKVHGVVRGSDTFVAG